MNHDRVALSLSGYLTGPGAYVVLAICVILNSTTSCGNTIDADCLARFRGEATTAWRQWFAFANDIEVTAEERMVQRSLTRDGEEKEEVTEWKLCIARTESGKRWLIERETKGKNVFSVLAFNGEYSFGVAQVPKGSSYQVSSVRRAGADGPPRGDATAATEFWALHAASQLPIGVGVEELVDAPYFRLLHLAYINDGKLIRIESQCLEDSADRLRQAGHHYWAVVDPQKYWTITEAGLKNPETGYEARQELEFQTTADGFPFVRHLAYRMSWPRIKSSAERVWTFETPQKCQHAQGAFYLANYGIPESVATPAVAGSANASKRWWLLALGIVGLLIAWLIRRRGSSHV